MRLKYTKSTFHQSQNQIALFSQLMISHISWSIGIFFLLHKKLCPSDTPTVSFEHPSLDPFIDKNISQANLGDSHWAYKNVFTYNLYNALIK